MSDEYNPLQALLIGSGAAAESGLNQLQRAYYLARLGLANRWQGPQEAARHRMTIRDLVRTAQDHAALYQPLREAHPYATAVGEAIPAFLMGRGAGTSALNFNAGRAALSDLAPSSVSQLVTGLSRF